MRLETQNTIETLRDEFDQLVKELAKYKKKETNTSMNNASSSPQPTP